MKRTITIADYETGAAIGMEGGCMSRERIIGDLSDRIETLARMHIQHGLHGTEGFAAQRSSISALVDEHKIDVRKELDPLSLYFYRRYFG